jgi:hypothetical protein
MQNLMLHVLKSIMALALFASLALGAGSGQAPSDLALGEHLDNWDAQAGRISYRFIVGGDLHFGDGPRESYARHAEDLVTWLNAEARTRGLDLFILNGDITHDTTELYEDLRDQFLARLAVPYYALKGNHDFLRADQDWATIWGNPENLVVTAGDLALVLADTSVGVNDRVHYSAADSQWLAGALADVAKRKHVFVIMHIAQRKAGVTVDGYTWPKYGVGHQGTEDVAAA